ncbi:hypothetical protein CLPUN_12470 [Clostridium puniceum]|uniref:ACR n=1 Tax=Clostridium puniceum TaxID=29367 RepID=A0A1S8TS85_9CLOT|nr:DUF192 domain-containing protein [Clostridium puniceum]OOM80581.1 hypothetical protein CLPUN_12470 [Clostridium puniceum]
MEIINKNNNKLLANRVIEAGTFITRLKGLMFEKRLEDNTAMFIYPCNSVHTYFMKFSLDILFVSKEFKVLHLVENMKPGNISCFVRKSMGVLELPAGTIKKTNTKKGDFLHMIN